VNADILALTLRANSGHQAALGALLRLRRKISLDPRELFGASKSNGSETNPDHCKGLSVQR
jgi:hypothetical protein